MIGWLKVPASAQAINLALVVNAQVRGMSDGTVRFFYGTPGGGSYVDVDMGATDADAEDALSRLVDAVDPASYS